MNALINVRVLAVRENSGEYLDKVSGQRKEFHAVKLSVVAPDGTVGVFSYISNNGQPAPEPNRDYTLELRKFEDSNSCGATGLCVGWVNGALE